ncbi:PIG-L family deacetylase [Luteimonas sp. TWI662]|uniref:PIG-L deacetylase family protein n=1 Tax=unclassified Luteimonas TaxID=2629088 RepID=UPI003207BE35
MDAVAERRAPAAPTIVGDGQHEGDWRASAWLQALPRVTADACLAGVARLVVVSPHPDDEVLGCGGLMVEAGMRGLPVHVVSVTDGEACYADDPQWPPAHTRAVRRAELRAALDMLGGSGAPATIATLALGDGRVGAGESALAERIATQLRAGDRVLTTWRHDGHPDHEATARATAVAVRRAGASLQEFPVWGWHWLDPAAASPPFADAYAVGLSMQAVARKARALDCFVSQRAGGHATPILPPHVIARFSRDFEVLLP